MSSYSEDITVNTDISVDVSFEPLSERFKEHWELKVEVHSNEYDNVAGFNLTIKRDAIPEIATKLALLVQMMLRRTKDFDEVYNP